jgi:hypothetical protein
MDTLQTCEYGVVCYRDARRLLKQEPLVPLRHVCRNLRHELNCIIQFLINQAVELDRTVSANSIDIDNPCSRIVAGALAIDHFIQMLNGVNEFQPDATTSTTVIGGARLSRVIANYFAIYSLITRASMSRTITLQCRVDEALRIGPQRPVISYIVAVLVDNAWKYALDGSTLVVVPFSAPSGLCSVSFENDSLPLPTGMDPFTKGAKADPSSRGFGYGLHWARILVDHYNRMLPSSETPLKLSHSQNLPGDGRARQTFLIENIRTE